MNTLDYALLYIRRGYAPVPIAAREKRPRIPSWQNLRITETSAPKFFNGAGNIGIILGGPSRGLVDVDLDCLEAIKHAPELLPTAAAVFGRGGKPRSHRLYRVKGAAPSLTFKDPIAGDMLVELRGDGGRQTVFPPSIHPSGERIEWEADGDPATIDYSALRKAVACVAARCLVARYLPRRSGSRKLAQSAWYGGSANF
jgi:putative DNA primase/helicase